MHQIRERLHGGGAPEPAGGAHSAPPDPLAGFCYDLEENRQKIFGRTPFSKPWLRHWILCIQTLCALRKCMWYMSRAKPRLSALFFSMLFQYEFSRSTALVSQSCALVEHPTWLGWLFGVVLITPHAIMWVFTAPYMSIFPYAISGTTILCKIQL